MHATAKGSLLKDMISWVVSATATEGGNTPFQKGTNRKKNGPGKKGIDQAATFICTLFMPSNWGLGRAAVCDCGTPWTFLLFFS